MPLQRVINAYLERRIDPRPRAAVRIAVGLAGILGAIEVYALGSFVVAPGILALPMVPGMPRLTPETLPIVVAVWMCAAILVLLGTLMRPAGLFLAGLIGMVLLSEQQLYSNHLYLLAIETALVAIGPSDAVWSLAARGKPQPTHIPGWSATLLQLQLSSVYLYGALSKLNPVYLSGAVLANQEGVVGMLADIAGSAATLGLTTATLLIALSVGAVLIELLLILFLWQRRLRLLAIPLGVILHGIIQVTMGGEASIGIGLVEFMLLMLPPYSLFFAGRND
jgi:hypothetical protein